MLTKIICLEGVIGAGKTFQSKKIAERLDSLKKSYLIINEKKYQPFKQTIIDWHNTLIDKEFTLNSIKKIAKARGKTHQNHFIPLIGKKEYIIFDRSLYTSAVYQATKSISMKDIIEINLAEGSIQPEEGLVLLCSPKTSMQRADKRRKEKHSYNLPSMNETLEGITHRREMYIHLLDLYPELNLVDAEQSEEEVFWDIQNKLGI